MHGISPEDEIDYWRERARRAETASHRSRLSAEDVAGLRWLLYLPLPVKNEQERQHSIAAMAVIARLIGEGQ